MIKKRLLLFLSLFNYVLFSQHDSLKYERSFHKNSKVLYVGSGAFIRHIDLNKLNSNFTEYSKTPAIIIGADFCITTKASNAYLGLGPYFTGWYGLKEYNVGNDVVQKTFSNTTLACRLTHHVTFFVRKKLDVCSSYILGVNLKYYHTNKLNGTNYINPDKQTEVKLAGGLTLTIKYYFYKKLGGYIEGGVGYRINMLNVGFCYKL